MAAPHEPAVVTVKTNILYGVFASHKSFLIGTRCLVKREYATWLAKKATGDKLPQELVDVVAEALYRLEHATVLAKWHKHLPLSGNAACFACAPSDTESYRRAMRKINAIAPEVNHTIVANDRPHLNNAPKGREAVTYVHLSAAQHRPRLALNLPPNSPNVAGRAYIPLMYPTGGRGMAAVSLAQGPGLSQDTAAYRTFEDRPDTSPAQVSRLLQCEGLEDAMRDWDAEALRRFVNVLELQLVPFDGMDPIRPGVHVLQTFVDS